jgi:translation elongation factor EF-G
VVVLDGVAGVQVQSEKVWRQADQYAIPRLIFVNKLDRLGADIHHVLRTIEGSLGVQPLLLQLPLHRRDAASTTEPTPSPAHVPATAQPLPVQHARPALLRRWMEITGWFMSRPTEIPLCSYIFCTWMIMLVVVRWGSRARGRV